MSGEFFPVMIVPSMSSMAAPQKISLFPFPVASASFVACNDGNTLVGLPD
jgi:hypothetical protein